MATHNNGPLACVDLGTNTCHLLVAQRRADGTVAVLADVQDMVRLGQGVDATRKLHPDAKARTLASLTRHARTARELGAVALHLVATSAMRDAQDGAAFAADITRETGFEARIITGEEEAALTWASAIHDGEVHGTLNVFDVGGGSTELMFGGANALSASTSVDVGTVRMTERYLHSDPPSRAQTLAMRGHVARALRGVPCERGAPLVGMAGTVTTLAACIQGHPRHDAAAVHGSKVGLEQVEAWLGRLAGMTHAQRLEVPALEPGRADLIVSGACIVAEVMHHVGVTALTVSDRGVRWGLFWQVCLR